MNTSATHGDLRLVTPEVAGSSPVGRAKIASLISRHFGGVRVFSGLR